MDLNKEQYTIDDLFEILTILRSENGCPWDKVQTHQSLKKNMIEECYEAVDALDNGNDKDFANELGDVLLQVAFHAQLAKERGAFDFDDVLNEICTKLIRRHTHVFGNEHAGDAAEALQNWEANKKKEKNLDSYTAALKEVPHYLPALMRAQKIQKKAAAPGFDWDNIDDVYAKVEEELEELRQADTPEHIEEEFGDLLFSVVNLGRFLKLDCETALSNASNKFIGRFEKMENVATAQGKALSEINLAEMDSIWKKIKEI